MSSAEHLMMHNWWYSHIYHNILVTNIMSSFPFNQLSCGVQAGFRNSGISLKSRKNSNQEWPKIIVAIRSTHGIEAPLSTGGKLLVTSEVINLSKLIMQYNASNFSTEIMFYSMLTMLLLKLTCWWKRTLKEFPDFVKNLYSKLN